MINQLINNIKYQIISWWFDENTNKIDYNNSEFNTKKCVDNDNLLSNQENKSIIIKAISDEGLSKSKPCFGFHRYNW